MKRIERERDGQGRDFRVVSVDYERGIVDLEPIYGGDGAYLKVCNPEVVWNGTEVRVL